MQNENSTKLLEKQSETSIINSNQPQDDKPHDLEEITTEHIEDVAKVDTLMHVIAASDLEDNLAWEREMVQNDTGKASIADGYQKTKPGTQQGDDEMSPKFVMGNYSQELERTPTEKEDTSKVLNSVTDLVKASIPVVTKAAGVNPWVAAGLTAATLLGGSAAIDRFLPKKEQEKPVVRENEPINFGLEFVEPKIIKGQ